MLEPEIYARILPIVSAISLADAIVSSFYFKIEIRFSKYKAKDIFTFFFRVQYLKYESLYWRCF